MPETLKQTWAQQVLDEHRELRRRKARLDDFLQAQRPDVGANGAHTWAAELARQLLALHDALFRHFRFEEESGMASIPAKHPRATANVERLLGEHPEMLGEVRGLMDLALTYAEGREPEDTALRRRVSEFLRHLDRHEADENGMIYDLELLDLGLGD